MDKNASTCARCRAKKTRCDGKDPCGPCSRARTAATCNYTTTTVYRSELRKGAACSACRREEKKCSGEWPCHACVTARKEDDCKFDGNSKLSSTRALIERTRELGKLLYQAKQITPDILDHQLRADVLNELDQLDSTSDPIPLTIREDAEAVASSNEAGPSDPTPLKPVSFDLAPVTSGDPNLDVSLGVVPNLDVRTETEEEKLFRLRDLFLQVAPQYGFSLSQKKLDAIAKGDMTGLAVHPVLVHVCHLFGYLLEFLQQTGSLICFGAEEEPTYMRLIEGSLNGMFGPTPDPVTSTLTYMTVSCYFFRKAQVDEGQKWLASASTTALEHDMDLACLENVDSDETLDQVQGFSVFPINDADEMRAVLSYLIFVGTVVHLLVKNPLVVDVRLVDKFSLLMSTQVATHVDVNFMRAKSVRLFAETREFTSTWNASASRHTSWFGRYWKLIAQIHSHIGLLQPAILKTSFIPEYHTVELALKLSTVLALAALADLHGTFAPSHPESSRRYRDILIEIVSISSTFASDDFQHLGTILSLCWTVATQGILDNRIVYENQQSIIATIRQCNQNLKQAWVDLDDIMPDI
ncbi:hypothetical protein C8J57DRAFT_1715239 [Mycena rebaudengoi]|nr:hypothetical protein C8J57DRAFT_1715239 [Mycena rebaudengoi]